MIEEIRTRLARPKFAAYVDPTQVAAFVAVLSDEAEIVEITGELRACRDPDDDVVLETAIRGRAGCILTGDRDLLTLDPFRDIRIVTPSAFIAAVGSLKGS
jgi:putative PIN family toxin of toxin-antitoxin system